MLVLLSFLCVLLLWSLVLRFCLRRAAPLIAGAGAAWPVWIATHEWLACLSAALLVSGVLSLILDELAERPRSREAVLTVEVLCSIGIALLLGFAVLHSIGVGGVSLVLGVAATGVGLGAWAQLRLGY
jgi:hypothetical protein